MKKQRVLIPFFDLGLGGVQTKIIDLANELINENVNVLLVIRDVLPFDKRKELHNSVRVLYCPSLFPSIIKKRFNYLIILVLFIYRPTAIFVSLEELSLFILKIFSFFPFYRSKIMVNVDTNLKFNQKASNEVIRTYFSKASWVLAPSIATKKDLCERIGLSSSTVTYIPNWTTMPNKSRRYKQSAIFLGRFENQKRPEYAISIFKKLKKKKIKLHMDMYGTGSKKIHLLKIINKNNLDIKLYEPITNVSSVLSNKKYFILTSLYEGLSFALIESMAHGCVPVVLSRPGISEVINDGFNGISKPTVDEVAASLAKLEKNNDLYLLLSANAYSTAKKYYSEKNRDKIINLLLSAS